MPDRSWEGQIRTSARVGAPVRLGDVLVPRHVTVTITSESGSLPGVTARYEMRDGVPICTRVVTEQDRGLGITTPAASVYNLEALGLWAFLEHATTPEPDGGHVVPMPTEHRAEAVQEVRAAGRRRWAATDADLVTVARTYLAPDHRGEERRAVASVLQVSKETASRRIRDARERGFLPAKHATDDQRAAALAALPTPEDQPPTPSQAQVRAALAARGHDT